MSDNYYVPTRVRFRGSHASAKIIARIVNSTDSVSARAGGAYATAEAEFDEISTVGGVLRDSAVCLVDAYDGRHRLHVGDELVTTETGWEVWTPATGGGAVTVAKS